MVVQLKRSALMHVTEWLTHVTEWLTHVTEWLTKCRCLGLRFVEARRRLKPIFASVFNHGRFRANNRDEST